MLFKIHRAHWYIKTSIKSYGKEASLTFLIKLFQNLYEQEFGKDTV